MPNTGTGVRNRSIRRQRPSTIRAPRVTGGPLQQFLATSPTSWYDARDITTGTQQTLTNRVGTGSAQLGSLGTSDTNDPVALIAPAGNGYVYLPGTANNNLGIARVGGWAATIHITATLTDNTTATFTSTADPIPIGNTSLTAGSYKRFDLRDTDGVGTLRATIDLTTETLGQSSWTCTTGQTITVNRATSGRVTTIVTRPLLAYDGVDDYVLLQSGDNPTLTPTTNAFSAMVVLRRDIITGSAAMAYSTESTPGVGVRFFGVGSSTTVNFSVGGATTFAQVGLAGAAPALTTAACAITCNAGSFKGYSSVTDTQTAATDYTGVGTITYSQGRLGVTPSSGGNPYIGSIMAAVIWRGRELTLTELRTASTYLLGTYT